MISPFVPPGVLIEALRSGYGIVAGERYTVRGFVLNRHWRTREPDPHVLLTELLHPVGLPKGKRGEIGFPRDGFVIPDLCAPDPARELADAA